MASSHLTADQSRAARGLLNWSRARLAAKCSLGEGTISDFENGRRIPSSRKLAAMRQAFEGAGVVFRAGDASLADLSKSEVGANSKDNRTWRRRLAKGPSA
ncbi:helix-turn-helix transcriptional regulator [Mesorhizobium sp. WSM4898]|uniref:helix-turn-helix domain-containing protein n=1 Tax=Mesorhizobium sp. WSM4898 TaxID=3038544 RepID=UPI0024150704|nr:helix-turn-helix transcriptional regulator [Mesorhizobium sp. WSM4898]MDG4908418.1 helix-turn-helix transcriptional regulator [Mesorhizobium sp. WSM4898]